MVGHLRKLGKTIENSTIYGPGPRLFQVLDPLESVCHGRLVHLVHLVHLVLPGLALEEAVDKQCNEQCEPERNADPMYKTRIF